MLVSAPRRSIHPGAVLGRIGNALAVRHEVAIVAIALLAMTSYLLLESVASLQGDLAVSMALSENGRMLTQRIAGLSGQYALGNAGVRADLRAAIADLENTQRRLVQSDGGSAGMGNAVRDAGVADFVRRARVLAALPPGDPRISTAVTPIFAAAQRPLLEKLEFAANVRQARAQRAMLVPRVLDIGVTLALLATILAYALGIVRPLLRRVAKLAADAAEFARQATIDPLTGTLNGRSFQDRGAIEIQKARRYNRPLSLLIIDTDHFAAISETYGDNGAQSVLKALSATMFDATRVTDLVGRVGPEEFAILLPETDPAGAKLLAERLRTRISSLAVPVKNRTVSCTVSIGVAAAEKDAAFFGPTYKRADEALYEAKMRGRNRVIVKAA